MCLKTVSDNFSSNFRHLATVELIIPISGFIVYPQIDVSVIIVHLEVASECCCCGEVGTAFGKPGFDRIIKTSRCIRPSCTNLKLTGPMLRDKNGRSYKRKTGQSERQYV